MKYTIEESVLVGIRRYLGTRPFDEVAEGVLAIERIINEQKPKEEVPVVEEKKEEVPVA